ncbi:MAG: right-handed parallel beta-helix repeat-containing protein [Chloroflexota bacterium]
MAEDQAPNRALAKLSDQTLAPARSLAERTLAALLDRSDNALAVPRRLIVAADGSAMFTTIGAAISVAVDGDEIVVEPGRYVEHLTIDRSIRLSGHGARDQIVLAPPTPEAACIVITRGAPHLAGFTLDSRPRELVPELQSDGVDWHLLQITGGAPVLEALDLAGRFGIGIHGAGTKGVVRLCSIHDGLTGISVRVGAQPTIEHNEIWGLNIQGLDISWPGTAPLVRENRIHHVGIGIRVSGGAEPRIEGNEIWASEVVGIRIGGRPIAPLVRANRIHDGRGQGIHVFQTNPRIEDNEIWANQLEGLCITGIHSSPSITGNTVRDGFGDGIAVLEGASPTIYGNTVTGNAQHQIRVADDASPVIGENVISA